MVTGMATAADAAMVIVAIVAIVATAATVVVIATEARATAMEVQAAMAADMVHRTVLLTLLLLLLVPLTPLITTPSMPSGPLTMHKTRAKTHMLRTAASQQLWLSTLKATDSTMVRLTQPDRHSLLHPALELQHHRLHPQSLPAMELLRPLLRHPLVRQELAMVQFLPHQACKCLAASSISPKCTKHRFSTPQSVKC